MEGEEKESGREKRGRVFLSLTGLADKYLSICRQPSTVLSMQLGHTPTVLYQRLEGHDSPMA